MPLLYYRHIQVDESVLRIDQESAENNEFLNEFDLISAANGLKSKQYMEAVFTLQSHGTATVFFQIFPITELIKEVYHIRVINHTNLRKT